MVVDVYAVYVLLDWLVVVFLVGLGLGRGLRDVGVDCAWGGDQVLEAELVHLF